MDQFVDLLKEINIVQIFIILSGIWGFYSRLDKKIDTLDERLSEKINKLDERLGNRIDKLDLKIDKLSEKVEDVDRRLCRIEGSLATQGHCLFNQVRPEQKAE